MIKNWYFCQNKIYISGQKPVFSVENPVFSVKKQDFRQKNWTFRSKNVIYPCDKCFWRQTRPNITMGALFFGKLSSFNFSSLFLGWKSQVTSTVISASFSPDQQNRRVEESEFRELVASSAGRLIEYVARGQRWTEALTRLQ